jgi:ankyrin repeat protein
MKAARKGHEEVVRLLLTWKDIKPGMRVHRTSWTALTFAARGGHDAIVRLLLERDNTGADKAMVHAAGGGHEAIVQLFLERNDLNPESIFSAVMSAWKMRA